MFGRELLVAFLFIVGQDRQDSRPDLVMDTRAEASEHRCLFLSVYRVTRTQGSAITENKDSDREPVLRW